MVDNPIPPPEETVEEESRPASAVQAEAFISATLTIENLAFTTFSKTDARITSGHSRMWLLLFETKSGLSIPVTLAYGNGLLECFTRINPIDVISDSELLTLHEWAKANFPFVRVHANDQRNQFLLRAQIPIQENVGTSVAKNLWITLLNATSKLVSTFEGKYTPIPFSPDE